MEIYLLRHAIAENGRPGMPDSERAITPEGREKLKRVLKRARSAGVEPTLILTSPFRRAIETAQMAAEALNYQGNLEQTRKLEPNASPHDVWDEIRSRKTEDAILLATHEPLVSATLALLLGSPALMVDVKKSALARLDCERFGAEPRCTLKWLLTPATAGE